MVDYINGTLRCVIAEEDLARHAPVSPLAVGVELSYQIREYEKQQQLGYFPAVEFFQDERFEDGSGLDADLLQVYDSLTWLGEELIRSEFRTRLRAVFLEHRILEIHHHAATLPKIRPGETDVANKLAAHYTPNRFKIDFQGRPQPRLTEDEVESAALFALRDSFERAEFIYYEFCKS